jgi:hypothetical protein
VRSPVAPAVQGVACASLAAVEKPAMSAESLDDLRKTAGHVLGEVSPAERRNYLSSCQGDVMDYQ